MRLVVETRRNHVHEMHVFDSLLVSQRCALKPRMAENTHAI
jgi:hypothetical protein